MNRADDPMPRVRTRPPDAAPAAPPASVARGGRPSVVFVRWPSEQDERARLADAAVPRMLLVEPGATPPDTWDTDEDWIRIPADPIDLHQRVEVLRRRCAPEVTSRLDADNLLWRGDEWVALSPVEAALVGALLGREGQLVRRAELERAAWPGARPDPRVLDHAISRARAKVAHVGLGIHRIPGAGYLLDAERRAGD